MFTVESYLPSSLPISIQLLVAGAIFLLLVHVYTTLMDNRPYAGFPVISLPEQGLSAKDSWFKCGRATINKGIAQGGPFQVVTGTGPKIVVPNQFADELKGHAALNFPLAFAKDLFAWIPGFEGIRQGLQDDTFIQEVVRVKLTQSLGLVTHDLVDETILAIHDLFGEDEDDWHSAVVKEQALDLVARLSSRVFLGKPLCRNTRWLEIAKNYTVDAFGAARLLRAVPPLLRPISHWFMPECRRLRQEVRDARALIEPEVERRKARAEKALAEGKKSDKTADTIGWMVEVAKGRKVDYVAGQLSLSLAAIHTTSEALTLAIMDICLFPSLLQPLREEAIRVLGEDGWSKTALYKLRLMDAFLKESQRFHPSSLTSMNRLVTSPVTLSDGTVLPTGSRIMVPAKYTDPTVFEDPNTFDPYRFLRERDKAGKSNSWQHVTTSSQHMGFGHGIHACPGRFFASNELKIALAHLLLKYDWQLEDQQMPLTITFEGTSMTNPMAKVKFRRRKEEIDLNGNANVEV